MDRTLVAAAVGVAILGSIATLVLWAARVPRRWAPAYAIARAAIQLTAIAFILRGVISDARWAGVAVAFMFTVAAVTCTRRLTFTWRRFAVVAGSMAAGVAVALSIAFGLGAIEWEPRYLLAFSGIVIGGTMAVSTLAGRHLLIGIHEKWEQVEGWLAIGGTPRQSTLAIARESVAEALIPTLDQTRTTGLVTLPGTFVGAIMGGASTADAGRFQIMVLAAVLAAGAISATLLVTALGPTSQRPERP